MYITARGVAAFLAGGLSALALMIFILPRPSWIETLDHLQHWYRGHSDWHFHGWTDNFQITSLDSFTWSFKPSADRDAYDGPYWEELHIVPFRPLFSFNPATVADVCLREFPKDGIGLFTTRTGSFDFRLKETARTEFFARLAEYQGARSLSAPIYLVGGYQMDFYGPKLSDEEHRLMQAKIATQGGADFHLRWQEPDLEAVSQLAKEISGRVDIPNCPPNEI